MNKYEMEREKYVAKASRVMMRGKQKHARERPTAMQE